MDSNCYHMENVVRFHFVVKVILALLEPFAGINLARMSASVPLIPLEILMSKVAHQSRDALLITIVQVIENVIQAVSVYVSTK